MQEIKLKRKLLETKKYEEYHKARLLAYKNNDMKGLQDLEPLQILQFIPQIEKSILDENTYMQYYWTSKYVINPTELEYKCFEQMRKSRSKQRQEIKNQLIFWIKNNYEITFNTYTLNEQTYNYYYSDIDKLQDKLTRLLVRYTDDYIGNIDYGSINDRVHFHVLEARKHGRNKIEIISGNKLNITNPITIEWEKYGFSYPELIRYNQETYNAVPSYLAKLCNHSIKVKTKRLFKKRKNSLYKRYKHWLEMQDLTENETTMTQFIGLDQLINKNIIDKKNQEKANAVLYEDQVELINLISMA